MKRIKNIGSKFIKTIKRYKYLLSTIFGVFIILWIFCLPKQLFDHSTSTVILDRDGKLLGATIARDGQWRFPHNDSVPEKFKIAILEFEDRNFERHLGVSVRGLSRAVYQNIKNGSMVSGGSTITMQIMRMSRNKGSRSLFQKLIEMFCATRAEWRYNKEELLAIYASNIPMGGNVVGIDAAAWRYFGRPAKDLSWAETSTLAVLPNAPSLMHPGKNREKLLQKRNRLLDRLLTTEKIDSLTWELAKTEPLPDKPHDIPRIAPHLLTRAIQDGNLGKVIHTSIDLNMQKRVNNIVQYHHEKLKENKIYNAAVLVMDIETAQVLAYTGNVPNLASEHGKDVDIIPAPRSSGSILKPFLYAGMLSDGSITPHMLIQDVPTVMSGYSPKNYNTKYDGIVPADEAIYRSLNVPLIRMLTKFGIEKFHHLLHELNFSTINQPAEHYGLSLILGGAETSLWDLVSAYGVLARSLLAYPEKPSNLNQKANYIFNSKNISQDNNYVINPANAYYMFEAMKEVQRPGEDINWDLFSTAQKIGWKTGTSYGFRDAWAVGTNGKYVIGVWVGNADGEGRPGLIGREAAAPILFDVFSSLPESDWFKAPFDEMVEINICQKSGQRAGDACEPIKKEWLPKSSLRSESCQYHEFIYLDASSSYRVNSACYELSNSKKTSWFRLPALVEYYYKNVNPNYKKLPPYMPGCEKNLSKNAFTIIYPKSNSQIFIPTNLKEVKEKIILEATHLEPNVTLFWHLDNIYLGKTQYIHQIESRPEPGLHTLKVIDELGNEQVVKFAVIIKPEN